MLSLLRIFALASALVYCCQGYKTYQANIPNGGAVPHPCKSNYIWEGVGHRFVLGGGARNPFGAAFAAADYTWTTALCEADSDQDGVSNGEELGDPNCIWTAGDTPARTDQLSHPGVCEPTTSADCIAKNEWDIDCSEGADFTCHGIDEEDTIELTLRLDNTSVPTAETTYMCQSYDIPSDRKYHLFASKPVIDNAYIMHHTLVYGCKEDIDGFDTPANCDMGSEHCTTIIASWTLGLDGECSGENEGILVGQGYFTKVLIEQHWNNPTNEANHYDSSGMTLYLTPNLRQYNLGFLITGQEALTIPANRQQYSLEGICPKSCMQRKLKDTIYVNSAHVHMHYLGASAKIEQWRNGELYDTWVDEPSYSYELPIVNEFYIPKELRTTDEIRTICTYDSTSRNEQTYFGEGTSDEMCYGFLTYYPLENGPEDCISYEDYDACELEDYYDDSAASAGISLAVLLTSALLQLCVN